ncbi:RDD family protein [Streptomyces sp. NPDC047973]|uniref:RDD family protein n=1 Tax=Streptomyces sp. NPDC047973 TaxID=3155383 RepID=UPI00342CBE35
MDELVTGDAVVLGLRPARLPSRALAIAIDLTVLLTVFVLLSVGLAVATAALDEAAAAAVAVASFLLVLVGGPVAVETLTRGRSLGKLACGLRVVRDDGGPIRFRHALVRGAMGMVEILGTFGVVGSIASLVSARGRRLGDVFAGTLVVRERLRSGRAFAPPPPPPWLVGRFAQLDLSGVPDGLWLAVRQYLTRMNQLDGTVRAAMADRLAWDLSSRTGVPVPTGLPSAAYLAAVAAERHAREVRRIAGAAASQADGAGLASAPDRQFSGSHERSVRTATPGPAPASAPRKGAAGGGSASAPHPDRAEGPASTGFAPPA